MDFSILKILLPELYLAIAVVVLFGVGIFVPKIAPEKSIINKRIWHAAILILIVGIAIIYTMSYATSSVFSSSFIIDPLSYVFKILVLISALITTILSARYSAEKLFASYEHVLLILLATIGMLVTISANNFIILYVSIELTALSMYVILALDQNKIQATEASLKYYILGAISTGMMLYGISFIYGATGSLEFSTIASLLANNEANRYSLILTLGLVLIIIGMGFKFSAAPFHMWTPDVYQGSSVPMVLFFSTATKLSIIVVMIRLFWNVFGSISHEWRQVVIILAILSLVVGSVMTVYQKDIKKLIAYTSVASAGYVFMALIVPSSSSLAAIAIYLITNSFALIGLFICVMNIRVKGDTIEKISDLAGLSTKHPLLAFSISTYLFSMAGIPPLAGFMGKLYNFIVMLKAGYLTIAIFGILASAVSAFFFLSIIKTMYFDKPDDSNPITVNSNLEVLISTIFLIFTLGFVVFAGFTFDKLESIFALLEFMPK